MQMLLLEIDDNIMAVGGGRPINEADFVEFLLKKHSRFDSICSRSGACIDETGDITGLMVRKLVELPVSNPNRPFRRRDFPAFCTP